MLHCGAMQMPAVFHPLYAPWDCVDLQKAVSPWVEIMREMEEGLK